MANILFKKSYLHKNLKETEYRSLWNSHGIFTTMRVIGKPFKILFFKEHVRNFNKSLKDYKINNKYTKKTIHRLIRFHLNKKKKYNHLLRIASNNKIISISLRKKVKTKLNFKIKFVNYKRTKPEYKNLKYKKILKILSKLDTTKFDIALYKNKKILETGTSNFLFVKNNKILSPDKDCYKGTTIKFFSKKFKINYTNIFLNNLNDYDEILIIGSGKGVVSVSSIEKNLWRRKSTKLFNKLLKIYKSEVKNN